MFLNLMNFMFILSLLMFCFYYKHILLTLISLEFIMVNLMMIMYLNFLNLSMNMFFFSFFLAISVCESVLGLSLLIYLIRFTGNDFLKSLNLMKW